MAKAVMRCDDTDCQEYLHGTAAYMSASATLWDAYFDGMKITQQTLGAATTKLERALGWFVDWHRSKRNVSPLTYCVPSQSICMQ